MSYAYRRAVQLHRFLVRFRRVHQKERFGVALVSRIGWLLRPMTGSTVLIMILGLRPKQFDANGLDSFCTPWVNTSYVSAEVGSEGAIEA